MSQNVTIKEPQTMPINMNLPYTLMMREAYAIWQLEGIIHLLTTHSTHFDTIYSMLFFLLPETQVQRGQGSPERPSLTAETKRPNVSNDLTA
jgi:hypothetical protein